MKNKNEKGFAIIFLLVLTAALMISLSTAIAALYALHKNNRDAKLELKEKAKSMNKNLSLGTR